MRPIAGFIVILAPDGRIISHGSFEDALAFDPNIERELKQGEQSLELMKDMDHVDMKHNGQIQSPGGKLVVAEEVATGRISRRASALLSIIEATRLCLKLS
jgi:hypothetical protein